MADIRVPLSTANDKELNDIYRRVTDNAAANKALDVKKVKACDTTPDSKITDGAEEEALLAHLSTLGSSITVYDENNVPTQYHTSTIDGKVTITASGVLASSVINGNTVIVEEGDIANVENHIVDTYLATSEVRDPQTGKVVRLFETGQVLTPLEIRYAKLSFRLELEAAKANPKIARQRTVTKNGVMVLEDKSDAELVEEQEILIAMEGVVTGEDIIRANGKENLDFARSEQLSQELLPLKQAMRLMEWKASLLDSAVIYDRSLKQFREIFAKLDAYQQIGGMLKKGGDMSMLLDGNVATLAKLLGRTPEDLKKLDRKGSEELVQALKNDLLVTFGNLRNDEKSGITPAQSGYLMAMIARVLDLDPGWTEKRVAEAAGDPADKIVANPERRAYLGRSVDPYLVLMLADLCFKQGYSIANDGSFLVDKKKLDEAIEILKKNIGTFKSKKDKGSINAAVSMLLAKYRILLRNLVTHREDGLQLTGEAKKKHDNKVQILSDHAESIRNMITDNFALAAEYEMTKTPISDDEIVREGRVMIVPKSSSLLINRGALKAMAEPRTEEGQITRTINYTEWQAAAEGLQTWIRSVDDDKSVADEGKLEVLEIRLSKKFAELVAESEAATKERLIVIKAEVDKIRIMFTLINDYKNKDGKWDLPAVQIDKLAVFAKARAALYGRSAAALAPLNKDLEEKLVDVWKNLNQAATKRIETKIILAEESGRLEELISIGSSRVIKELAVRALEAAVRVAAKAKNYKELVSLGDMLLARANEAMATIGSENLDLGDLVVARADKQDCCNKAIAAYRLAATCADPKFPDELRAVGYRLLQLNEYGQAKEIFTQARVRNLVLAKDLVMEEEIMLCSQPDSLTPNPTGIDIKDCTLMPKSAIYGALKSVNADVSKLTEEDVVTAVKNLYRRNGFRASCIASYDSAKGVWTIQVIEKKITKVSVGSTHPVKMKVDNIIRYFPKAGELLDESRIRGSINNLVKNNPNVFNYPHPDNKQMEVYPDYEVIETADGLEVVLKVEEREKDGVSKIEGGLDQKGNSYVGGSLRSEDWSGTGKPFGASVRVGGIQDGITQRRFTGVALQSEFPISNSTSIIADYTYDCNARRTYDYRAGIKEEWNAYVSSTHTAGVKQLGKIRVINTEHSVTLDRTQREKGNNFGAVAGYDVTTSLDVGRDVKGVGDPYSRAEVTSNQYLSLLRDTFGSRLVFNTRETVGAGRGMNNDTGFRAEGRNNSDVWGDYTVGGRTELALNLKGLQIPNIKTKLPVIKWLAAGVNWVLIAPVNLLVKGFPLQPLVYAEGSTTPTYDQRSFDRKNTSVRAGAGLRVEILGLAIATGYVDGLTGNWYFNLGK